MTEVNEQNSSPQERLILAVQQVIATDPLEFEGKIWAVRRQADWAEMIGVSRQTVNELLKHVPFDVLPKSKDKVRINFVRIGQRDPLQPSRQVLDMRNAWVQITNQELLTSKQYGLCHGLVKDFRHGWAVPIFKHIIHPNQWGGFMNQTRTYIIETGDPMSGPFFKIKDGKTPMFFEFPHIPTLRLFWFVAEALFVEDMIDFAGQNGLPPKSFFLDWWQDIEEQYPNWQPNWSVKTA